MRPTTRLPGYPAGVWHLCKSPKSHSYRTPGIVDDRRADWYLAHHLTSGDDDAAGKDNQVAGHQGAPISRRVQGAFPVAFAATHGSQDTHCPAMGRKRPADVTGPEGSGKP